MAKKLWDPLVDLNGPKESFIPDSAKNDEEMYQRSMEQHRRLLKQYTTPVPVPVAPHETDKIKEEKAWQVRCSGELDEDDHHCHQHIMAKEDLHLSQQAPSPPAPTQTSKWTPIMGDPAHHDTPPITLLQRAPEGECLHISQ